MRCEEVQQQLSLYLYGELDFSAEESVENHLFGCESCREAVAREKHWHAALEKGPSEVPLEMLSRCRRDLHESLEVLRERRQPTLLRWLDSLGFHSNAWSMRIATASLLVCLGFGLSRLADSRGYFISPIAGNASQMSMLDPLQAHVRNVANADGDRVQIVVDEVRERVITGSRNDDRIRQLLVAASKEALDPAVRLDSVEILKDDPAGEVRAALLDSVRSDPNAGVRLKALEALGQFEPNSQIRDTLLAVLSHDENPDVRTQAVNLLAPPQAGVKLTPQIADALESVMRSDPDSYIRMRCQQALKTPHASVSVY